LRPGVTERRYRPRMVIRMVVPDLIEKTGETPTITTVERKFHGVAFLPLCAGRDYLRAV
jgi:hypothetical protein